MSDPVTVENDKNFMIEVLDNDDPGNSSFAVDSLDIVTEALHATTSFVHNDHLHYRAVDGYIGSDIIEYEICYTNGLCDIGIVTITVTTSHTPVRAQLNHIF